MALKNSFQPLYKQVYDVLTQRLVDGYWKPAEALPSEFAIADELGVSQGTVRKALNQMVLENLLERRQGKGTYVAEHTDEGSLFRFYRLRHPSAESQTPETKVVSVRRRAATKEEASHLGLAPREKVSELLRVRYIDQQPVNVETVVQPLSVFPDIDKIDELPNALYILYQEKYGINIVSVTDELRAVAMPEEFADYIDIDVGTPVLVIERKSNSMDGRVVEFSRSYVNSENFVYSVDIK